MDNSQPGSSVHGISQARILEWVAISFSKGSWRSWRSHFLQLMLKPYLKLELQLKLALQNLYSPFIVIYEIPNERKLQLFSFLFTEKASPHVTNQKGMGPKILKIKSKVQEGFFLTWNNSFKLQESY